VSPPPLAPPVTQETFTLELLRVLDGKGETSTLGGKGQEGACVLPSTLGDIPRPRFHRRHFKAMLDGKTIPP